MGDSYPAHIIYILLFNKRFQSLGRCTNKLSPQGVPHLGLALYSFGQQIREFSGGHQEVSSSPLVHEHCSFACMSSPLLLVRAHICTPEISLECFLDTSLSATWEWKPHLGIASQLCLVGHFCVTVVFCQTGGPCCGAEPGKMCSIQSRLYNPPCC